MIEKFGKKTCVVLTIILWSLLFGILLVMNIFNNQSNRSETRKILSAQEIIVTLDPDQEDPPALGTKKELSIIYSVIVENENYQVVFSPEGSGYSKEDLIQIAKEIHGENKTEGIQNQFVYLSTASEEGTIISFMDYSIWERQQSQLLMISLVIGVAGMILLFFAAFLLTLWLIKPVQQAFEKQKQFISDAGHELKTPLTVMKASIDMIDWSQIGINEKYISYIQDENTRMTGLVHQLLTLSSLEQNQESISLERFNLSLLTEKTCLPFECLAYENQVNLRLQIQENLYIQGVQNQIQQVIEILVDNGIKHTFQQGEIIVQLSKEKGKVILLVKNQGEPIPEEERSRIFDRFYRVDKARKRGEGRYGLGLAIANTIALEHKTRISLECKDNWTMFMIKFNV